MGHTTVVVLYAPEGCHTVNIQGKDAWFELEVESKSLALQTMLVELEMCRQGRAKTVVYRISGEAVATNIHGIIYI